jgi:hypothetical protein
MNNIHLGIHNSDGSIERQVHLEAVAKTERESALGRHAKNAVLAVVAKIPQVLVVAAQEVDVGFFGDVRASTFAQHGTRGGAAFPVVTTSTGRLRAPQHDLGNRTLVTRFKIRVRNLFYCDSLTNIPDQIQESNFAAGCT